MKSVLLWLAWYDRALHEGVADYAAKAGWILNVNMQFSPEGWRGDGIIARAGYVGQESRTILSMFEGPIVDVQSRPQKPRYPLVATNIDETVRLAFEYLRHGKGHRNFGFYGVSSSHRGRAFAELVRSQGMTCHKFHRDISLDFGTESFQVKKWLAESGSPMAVYCSNDHEASWLSAIAFDIGLAVPSELAIIGTDNDELICRSSACSLSSVETNLYQVGYQAAELLDQAMNGDPPEVKYHYVQPEKVVERQSTNALVVKSPRVMRAIEIMQRDYASGVTVADVVAEIGMSQTGLERAFKRELSITPGQCLHAIRMREAAKLLTETSEKVAAVGHMVGMPDPKHFCTAFKKHHGTTPLRYRKSEQ